MTATPEMLGLADFAPQVFHYEFFDPPDIPEETVEFRLVYRGKLPAASAGDTHAGQSRPAVAGGNRTDGRAV